jgi:magnesium transporter
VGGEPVPARRRVDGRVSRVLEARPRITEPGDARAPAVVRGEIEFKDIFRVLWKEVRVAVMVGLVLALFNYLRMIWISRIDQRVSLVVAFSMVVTVTLSKSLGCLLPMIAKRLRMDPAVVASQALTTLVDAASLLVLFSLAALMLR